MLTYIDKEGKTLEFCECGSIIIDGTCTNKKCSRSTVQKSTSAKKTKAKPTDDSKSKKTRRSSKVVTYSIEEYEKMKEKGE